MTTETPETAADDRHEASGRKGALSRREWVAAALIVLALCAAALFYFVGRPDQQRVTPRRAREAPAPTATLGSAPSPAGKAGPGLSALATDDFPAIAKAIVAYRTWAFDNAVDPSSELAIMTSDCTCYRDDTATLQFLRVGGRMDGPRNPVVVHVEEVSRSDSNIAALSVVTNFGPVTVYRKDGTVVTSLPDFGDVTESWTLRKESGAWKLADYKGASSP